MQNKKKVIGTISGTFRVFNKCTLLILIENWKEIQIILKGNRETKRTEEKNKTNHQNSKKKKKIKKQQQGEKLADRTQ